MADGRRGYEKWNSLGATQCMHIFGADAPFNKGRESPEETTQHLLDTAPCRMPGSPELATPSPLRVPYANNYRFAKHMSNGGMVQSVQHDVECGQSIFGTPVGRLPAARGIFGDVRARWRMANGPAPRATTPQGNILGPLTGNLPKPVPQPSFYMGGSETI